MSTTASTCRPCRSTARPARSSTPRSGRWSDSPAGGWRTRWWVRFPPLRPTPPRGRYDPDARRSGRGPADRGSGPRQTLRGADRRCRRRPHGQRRRRLRLPGSQRCRQDHVAADDARTDHVPPRDSVRLFGRDPMEGVQALEGVAGFVEAPAFYPYLTGRRNLELLAAFDGDGAVERIDSALATVELTHRAGDRVGGYSHGMRQRLGLAASLLRDPKLLLLDEPATGLDPGGMRDMRLLIRRLADEGITVLLSSHLLTEVEELCNRVAIVRSGSIVYEGAISELKRGAGTSYRLSTTDDARALAVCRAQPGLSEVVTAGDRITFSANESCGGRALAGPGRGWCPDPRAGAADGHARGPVLLAHRRAGRHAGARCGRAPIPSRRTDAGRRHRLPLGADQAPLPEAHLSRPRRGRRGPDPVRGRHRASRRRAQRRRRSAPTSTRAGWPFRWSSCCSAPCGCSR